MAKDSSFDIVSQVDLQEIDNAVQQTVREVAQRYDLKTSGATVEFARAEATVTVAAPADFTVGQVVDVFETKLVRRKIDLAALRWSGPQDAAGGSTKNVATVVNGIDADTARSINKDIRAEKLKVKVQIEGDKLRVSGPKKDALQDVIAFVKSKDYGLPLQFTNYR